MSLWLSVLKVLSRDGWISFYFYETTSNFNHNFHYFTTSFLVFNYWKAFFAIMWTCFVIIEYILISYLICTNLMEKCCIYAQAMAFFSIFKGFKAYSFFCAGAMAFFFSALILWNNAAFTWELWHFFHLWNWCN